MTPREKVRHLHWTTCRGFMGAECLNCVWTTDKERPTDVNEQVRRHVTETKHRVATFRIQQRITEWRER
jgi:hypothetical protein